MDSWYKSEHIKFERFIVEIILLAAVKLFEVTQSMMFSNE